MPSAGLYRSIVAVQPGHERELSPEPASVSDLSTCYWQVLVTLDGVVGQASIEICNGFLANIVTNHVRQSEGRRSVLSVWALTLTLPQEE